MSPRWRWYFFGYLVTAPLAIIAFAYAVTIADARSWEWRDGVLTFVAGKKVNDHGAIVSKLWGNPKGQGWSWIVGFADEQQRNRADLRVHEFTHVVQAFIVQSLAPLLVAGWYLLPGLPWWADTLILLGAAFPWALAYGVCFFWPWLLSGFGAWREAYHANVFEQHAYKRQARFAGWEWGA